MKILTPCPKDGQIEVDSGSITLTLFDNPYGKPYYTFRCPICLEDYQKDANIAIVGLLFPMVAHEEIHIPLELAEEIHQGPPITESEIADFVIEMGRHERERA